MSLKCNFLLKFSAHDLAYEQYLKELQKKVNCELLAHFELILLLLCNGFPFCVSIFPVDLSTYNAVISCINHLGMDPSESWDSALVSNLLANSC